MSLSLVVWSVVMGPVFGSGAYWFVRSVRGARAHAPKDWRLPSWCGVVFCAIGLLAIPFPQLLGYGKGLAQTGFDSELGLPLAATLLLRPVVTLGALRAGATGGLLTPGLTIGALLGIVLGSLWNHAWPGAAFGAFAIIGSAAFLASSMKMPLTAIALIVEFTRIGHDFLIPISLAVAGSICVFYLCTEYNFQPVWRSGSVRISTLLSRFVDSVAPGRGGTSVTR
ncbi:MAG: chloride channel protein [Candidatus Sulfotelmatobacter sp.]